VVIAHQQAFPFGLALRNMARAQSNFSNAELQHFPRCTPFVPRPTPGADPYERVYAYVVWPMVEFEADDAMATATALALKTPASSGLSSALPIRTLPMRSGIAGGQLIWCTWVIIDEVGVVAKSADCSTEQ